MGGVDAHSAPAAVAARRVAGKRIRPGAPGRATAARAPRVELSLGADVPDARPTSVRRCRASCARAWNGEHPSAHHDRDPVRELQDLVEVGGEEDAAGWAVAVPRQGGDAGAHGHGGLHVEAAGRRLSHEEVAAAEKLAPRDDLLPVAAGERRDRGRGRGRPPSLRFPPSPATAPCGRRPWPRSARATFCEIVKSFTSPSRARSRGIQPTSSGRLARPSSGSRIPASARASRAPPQRDLAAADQDPALIRGQQPAENPRKRGLPRAVFRRADRGSRPGRGRTTRPPAP